MNRTIFHIDVNSAFLSWEAAYRVQHLGASLDLRNIPSVINGNMDSRHGIILAKSTPAKKYNISTGEPLVSAMKKCPSLYTAPPNYNLYQKCSVALLNLLREYAPTLEQYSIDEAFLDVTEEVGQYESPVAMAHIIRNHVEEHLGFTVNIGISSNKLLAKMASDFQKPNRVHTLWLHEIPIKMWPLPVRELFFVGGASHKKLSALGIKTIGDLACSDVNILKHHLNKHGETIWNYANGIDPTPVIHESPGNKGYGNATTVAFDVETTEMAKHVLLGLTETVATRLREDQVQVEVIAIQIKYFDLTHQSHQMTVGTATNITHEIYGFVCQLFDELWTGKPIRQLGVQTSRVKDDEAARQMNLFDTKDYRRYSKLDEAIDEIRNRHGMDAMKRAAFVDSKIDHLTGGITREKRSVDYSKLDIE